MKNPQDTKRPCLHDKVKSGLRDNDAVFFEVTDSGYLNTNVNLDTLLKEFIGLSTNEMVAKYIEHLNRYPV